MIKNNIKSKTMKVKRCDKNQSYCAGAMVWQKKTASAMKQF